MSESAERAPVGVVCDDRPHVRRTVTSLLVRCGFQVAAEVDSVDALRDVLRTANPVVAVIALPLLGMAGLSALVRLREDAPECRIVLLSPFGQLMLSALEAGATALVAEDDPQTLLMVLRVVARSPSHAERLRDGLVASHAPASLSAASGAPSGGSAAG